MDEADLFIPPTVVTNITPESNDVLMQSEIFGPILPIVEVGDLNEAIAFINRNDKPLALYVFSKNSEFCQRVENETSSGGFVANDVLVHVGIPELPFGGVGVSGFGAYHGKHGFTEFSHKKAVVNAKQNLEFLNKLRYHPLTEKKLLKLKSVLDKKPGNTGGYKLWVLSFLVGVVATIAYNRASL